MLTIGYFGDGPWAHEALKKILDDTSIKVKFLTVRYDKQDSVLIDMAKQNSIPVEMSKNINSEDFRRKMINYNVDLFVSMSFNQIFKANMIYLPRFKTINCHAGKLPYYRGRNVLNWALINDESEFGITVHYIDEGIDTGDIILQRTFPITDEDSYKTLLERSYSECASVLYDAIKQIQNNSVCSIKQDTIDALGMYCGMRQPGDEIINWNTTSREIFNFVRALCIPGPMATSWIAGNKICINKVKMVNGAKSYINIPGQVIGKTQEGFLVKTKDTFLEVVEYQCDKKIRVGDRLSSSL